MSFLNGNPLARPALAGGVGGILLWLIASWLLGELTDWIDRNEPPQPSLERPNHAASP